MGNSMLKFKIENIVVISLSKQFCFFELTQTIVAKDLAHVKCVEDFSAVSFKSSISFENSLPFDLDRHKNNAY